MSNARGTNPHFGPTLDATTALWDKIMEVDLRGAFLLCRAAAPAFGARQQDHPNVIHRRIQPLDWVGDL